MRAALNALASANPDWLREHADPEWFERYGRRIEDQRLPKGAAQGQGGEGRTSENGGRRWHSVSLARIDDPHTPQILKELAEVEILRQIWEQHYKLINGEIRRDTGSRPKRDA
jgi:transposase